MKDFHLSLMRLARLQGDVYNPMELQECINTFSGDVASERVSPKKVLDGVLESMGLPSCTEILDADPSKVPALIWDQSGGWGILIGQNALENWVAEYFDEQAQGWSEGVIYSLSPYFIAKASLTKQFSFEGSNAFQLIKHEMFGQRKVLMEATLGGIAINVIALGASLYSMQIYDRVMPTGAMSTLMVLTLGVLIAIAFELAAKISRAKLHERVIDAVDAKLSRAIFLKFLSIRLDQMPVGVGTVASQLRGYETVRGFLTSIITQTLVDLPFAIGFLVVIALLAGQFVIIPIIFLLLSLAVGFYFRGRIESHTSKTTQAANHKLGLLVESIEGAETIKSGHAGWRVLSKWVKANDDARSQETHIRHMSEYSQYAIAALQQVAYVSIVAIGALGISSGALTMGMLVAVSILAGRVLGSVATVPSQITQWGYAKAALKSLDDIWKLKDDHHNLHPIQLENIEGHFKLEDVKAQYLMSPALIVSSLEVQAGERVGVIGPVGSGKTTLLRILSGMYKPYMGRVLLDGFDLAHISKPVLANKIGYLQQEGRLFAGTLRENLILGIHDPGDEKILAVAKELGLMQAVINSHPMGLYREITEGGGGLSGGQKQLVNLTRVFLRNPQIWLLDEPTASMDSVSENGVLNALKNRLGVGDTLILVTHKPDLLTLVDRLIVIVGHQLYLDGPRDLVLQHLKDHGTSFEQENAMLLKGIAA
jgi:ATP-binding cassette, subfamily C, bacterial LapB